MDPTKVNLSAQSRKEQGYSSEVNLFLLALSGSNNVYNVLRTASQSLYAFAHLLLSTIVERL